jgi:hypothetical protein
VHSRPCALSFTPDPGCSWRLRGRETQEVEHQGSPNWQSAIVIDERQLETAAFGIA